MPHFAQAGHRFGPAEGLLDALADPLRDRIAGWRVVRPSIAERRPLWFCAICGVTALSRSSMTKSLVSYPLSTPSVVGCERLACGSISASAAKRSAWPEAQVVTAPTIRPLRFSTSAWPIKHSRASLPGPLR
jgi:hypothetical protein